jgi:transcriptional regulator with XRE-family HTH domain
MTKQQIGARVKSLREERTLSQEELARLIGTSRGTISHIETGRSWPSLRTIIRMMLELRVQSNYFFSEA